MSITIRPAVEADAATMRRLAAANPPLDVHTDYTYWVMCHAGEGLSFVAERAGAAVGFVATVPSARSSHAALLWQVCVDESERGTGVGRRLIEHARAAAAGHRFAHLEFTISPGNMASRALFGAVFGTPLVPRGRGGPSGAREDLFVVDLT